MAKDQKAEAFEISQAQETILAALRYKSRFGLEILRAIEENGGKMGFSSLYPNLKKMEKAGLVTSHWGDDEPEEPNGARRKYYTITEQGLAKLLERPQFLEQVSAWGFASEGV